MHYIDDEKFQKMFLRKPDNKGNLVAKKTVYSKTAWLKTEYLKNRKLKTWFKMMMKTSFNQYESSAASKFPIAFDQNMMNYLWPEQAKKIHIDRENLQLANSFIKLQIHVSTMDKNLPQHGVSERCITFWRSVSNNLTSTLCW